MGREVGKPGEDDDRSAAGTPSTSVPAAVRPYFADELDVSGTIVVQLADRLEEAGSVARERSERDRRVHLLTVTPAGADALARARRVMEDVHGDIAASVTPAEAKELHALCLRLLGAEAG